VTRTARGGGSNEYLHNRLERGPVEGLALESGHIARHGDLLLALGDDELEVGRCGSKASRLGGMGLVWRGTNKSGRGLELAVAQ
jgi:hypothetical protein